MNLKFSVIFSSTIEKLGAKFGVLSSTLRCFLNPLKIPFYKMFSMRLKENNFKKV